MISNKAYHVVSAFVAENQLTLGEIATEEKSNEITAVPELLTMLEIKNSTITADAISCQKEIVKTITEKKADYVIALKGNQPRLLEDVRQYFGSFSEEIPVYTTMGKDHGRIEKRNYQLLTELSWLPGKICKNCDPPKLKKSSIQKRRFRASLAPDSFLSILLGIF